MVKIFCDRCGKDCDLISYVVSCEVIHNPCPTNPFDRGEIKMTCDKSFIRMCMCQDCYREMKLPNIYICTSEKEIVWRD